MVESDGLTSMIKFLSTILKFACPLLVVAFPCMVAVGMLSPWSVAQQALGPAATHGTLLVGWSYSIHSSGPVNRERREQTYAVMPTLKTITVIQEDGNVRTEEDADGLLTSLASYACVLFGTWWFWFRRDPAESAKSA